MDSQLWSQLRSCDGAYFTAGDARTLQLARAAGVLVASPRAGGALDHGVALDALVLSANDARERRVAERVAGSAALVAYSDGSRGGAYVTRSGEHGNWAPAPVATILDSYGCGDSFAAALTYALTAGASLADAFALAARCGAACLAGRGPYETMLSSGCSARRA
jgi:ribokinase